MVRFLPITLISIIVVTLFVLLVYPAIFPVNAPPVLKTFKDIFVAVLAVVVLFACVSAALQWNPGSVLESVAASEPGCSLLCTLRC
ncbi:MAG TPA: hypothetical protein VG897_12490 [Terriglobales bacterium]|nr:hypothetical protein [Terriglobales bacterium]